MYEGKKVRLRALRREDAPFFVRWMNSYETQRNLGGQPHPLNLQDEERWIDSAFTRDDEHPFAVETLDGQLLAVTASGLALPCGATGRWMAD